MTVLVTGAAGFIGAATAERLLSRGEAVVGVDDFNPYYDVGLKRARTARLQRSPGFRLIELDVADEAALAVLCREVQPATVIHLAAQAGVRHSLDHPFDYERANVRGHLSVLEACRHTASPPHLVYASSSSVYGARPVGGAAFREDDPVDAPASLYAATKRAGELMSGAYARLYGLRQTGLRFFTVYGPWGRPDMAVWDFTRRIFADKVLEVFGEGELSRDFTYIDDIVDGVLGVIDRPADEGEHRLFNIGDDRPVTVNALVAELERACGRPARVRRVGMQPGDVPATHADIARLHAATGYRPRVMLAEGLARFVDWWRAHHDLTGPAPEFRGEG